MPEHPARGGFWRRWRRTIAAAALAAAAAAAAIGALVERHKSMYHFDVVDEGRLYRSGALTPRGLALVHRRTGFKTIVNLRTEDEIKADKGGWRAAEEAFARAHGVEIVDIPLPFEEPPDPRQASRFLSLFDDPGRLPVLVHCEYGVVRTGMMVALYRVKRMGMDAKAVLDGLEMYGHTFDDKAPAVTMFILGLKPDTPRTAPGP